MGFAIFAIFLVFELSTAQAAANHALQFDFTGYKNVATLLATGCSSTNNEAVAMKLINSVFIASSASSSASALDVSTKNTNHIVCVDDTTMSRVLQFTIYKNDNDPSTGYTDRQRVEMKSSSQSPSSQLATVNSSYIYSWWFKLDSTLKTSTGFFHIFQIKGVPKNGADITDDPLVTFSLTTDNGLHLRLKPTEGGNFVKHNMASLGPILGNWIQAYVQIQFSTGSSGYVRVILKTSSGNTLYDKKITNNNYWPKAAFYRPKWGLYRAVSNTYQPSDKELFQNVQIWRK